MMIMSTITRTRTSKKWSIRSSLVDVSALRSGAGPGVASSPSLTGSGSIRSAWWRQTPAWRGGVGAALTVIAGLN